MKVRQMPDVREKMIRQADSLSIESKSTISKLRSLVGYKTGDLDTEARELHQIDRKIVRIKSELCDPKNKTYFLQNRQKMLLEISDELSVLRENIALDVKKYQNVLGYLEGNSV